MLIATLLVMWAELFVSYSPCPSQVQSFEWSLIMDNFFTAKLELFQGLVSDCEYFLFRGSHFGQLSS